MSETKIRSRVDDPTLVERRRAQILGVAVELFSARGFHATTIRDIAERAGVSVGLIYQYFGDKEDLLFLPLLEIVEAYLSELPAAVAAAATPLARFDAAVRAYGRIIDRRRDTAVMGHREYKSLSRVRMEAIKEKELATNRLIAGCAAECVAAGQFRNVDVELVTYHCVVFAQGWAVNAWRFSRRMSVDEYITRGLRLILNGVLAEPVAEWPASPDAPGLASAAAG